MLRTDEDLKKHKDARERALLEKKRKADLKLAKDGEKLDKSKTKTKKKEKDRRLKDVKPIVVCNTEGRKLEGENPEHYALEDRLLGETATVNDTSCRQKKVRRNK